MPPRYFELYTIGLSQICILTINEFPWRHWFYDSLVHIKSSHLMCSVFLWAITRKTQYKSYVHSKHIQGQTSSEYFLHSFMLISNRQFSSFYTVLVYSSRLVCFFIFVRTIHKYQVYSMLKEDKCLPLLDRMCYKSFSAAIIQKFVQGLYKWMLEINLTI